MSDRGAWLAARHAAWQTPLELLDDAVRSATGARIDTHERIIAGEANETYRITTTDDVVVVLKVHHGSRDAFKAMQEASRMLLAAGINVPRVLLRSEVEVAGRACPLVVQTFIAGTPMSHLVPTASIETVALWTREAGALQARIHEIPVTLEPLPAGETLGSLTIADAIERVDGVQQRVRIHGIEPDRVRTLLERHRCILDRFAPCREHGDYGTDHIIIKDGHVAGIIDLDSTAVGTPITDIGWWDTYFDRAPHPTSLLLEGYRSVRDPGDIDSARWVFGLARGLEHLQYYLDVSDPTGEAFMLRRIGERLRQVEALG